MRIAKLNRAALWVGLTCSCSTPEDVNHTPTMSTAGSSASGGSASGGGGAGAGANTLGGGAAAGSSPIAGGNAGSASVAGGTGGGAGAQAMPDPVSTTPEAKWVNVTGNLAGMASECGNLGRVSAHPAADLLITGVAQKGLFASKDGGQSWQPLGTTGATITNRISYIAFDPAAPGVFWESGIYNGGGVYKTSDSGASFVQVGSATHCDSVSVDFTDPARMTLLAGSHEQARKLFRSIDAGANWKDIGQALPADSGFCTTSLILDAQTFLIGCGGWYGGKPGIQRTIDGGTVFEQVSDVGVAGQPLRAADGSIYWAGHQAGGLYKSTDQGQHFSEVADPSKARSVEPIELPDGRIVTVGATTLMISADLGASWEPLADPLPFTPSGVTYSAFRNAFYVWQWDCKDVVLPNAIMRFGYDYRK